MSIHLHMIENKLIGERTTKIEHVKLFPELSYEWK